MRWKIVSWNARGLWVFRDEDREIKSRVLRKLLERSDVVLVQETHVTPGVIDEVRRWASLLHFAVIGDPSVRVHGGLLAFAHSSAKDSWASSIEEDDSIQVLECKDPQDPGILVNFHGAPSSPGPLGPGRAFILF